MARARDSKLALERVQKYLGTADVKVSQLTRFYDCEPTLQPDDHRVDILERKLRQSSIKDGIHENHLRAVVDAQSLDRALQAGQLSRAELLERCLDPTDYPKLDFGQGELTCLGGQSRILAVSRIPPWDRRWPVDLYQEDISSGLRKQLRDKLNIQAPLRDGEVFLTFQQRKRAGDTSSMSQWGAYLSETKDRNLQRVVKPEWRVVLDSLSQIPALWQVSDFIGKLHKMQSFHLNSEYTHYLTEVKKCFVKALNEDSALMARLTTKDIRALQGTAPGKALDSLIDEGRLLEGFSNAEKGQFFRHLRSRPHMIPTIFTFFQDDKIISQCAPMILRLIDKDKLLPKPGSREPDIKASMEYMFEKEEGTGFSDQFEIEINEGKSRTMTASSHLRFELAYRQLWLYAIRHFLRPDHRKHRKIRFHIDVDSETVLLARFASKLRFSSESITTLASVEAAKSRTRVVLDEGSGFLRAEGSQKYGIPHPASWQWDRKALYLDRVYSVPKETNEVTTFFVLQSIFYNFFGCPDEFTPVETVSEAEGSDSFTPAVSDDSAAGAGQTQTQSSPPPPAHVSDDFTAGAGQTPTQYSPPPPAHVSDDFTAGAGQTPTQSSPPPRSASTVDQCVQTEPMIYDEVDPLKNAINSIDEILANLAQLQAKIKELKFIMPEIRAAMPGAVSDIEHFQRSYVNLPPEQKIPESPLIYFQCLGKALSTRIMGLEYAHQASVQLTEQLSKLKQQLQHSLTSNDRSLPVLQLIDLCFHRYSHYSCQVDDDFNFECEALTALGKAKYLKEVSVVKEGTETVADFKVKRESIEYVIDIAREQGSWIADLRNVGRALDAKIQAWQPFSAGAPTSWNSLESLDVPSCEALIKKHDNWIAQYNDYTASWTEIYSRWEALMKIAVEETRGKLKKGLRDLESKASLIMDENSRQEQQAKLASVAQLPDPLNWSDIKAYRDYLQEIHDALQNLLETINNQQQTMDPMVEDPASDTNNQQTTDPMVEDPPSNTINTDQKKGSTSNIADQEQQNHQEALQQNGLVQRHVEFIMTELSKHELGNADDYGIATSRYHDALNNAGNQNGNRLYDTAVALEALIYQTLRSKLYEKAKTVSNKTTNQQYDKLDKRLVQRHQTIHEDILKDINPGTNERKIIQNLMKKVDELLKYGSRESSRTRLTFTLWILFETGKCRTFEVTIARSDLVNFGSQLIRDGFQLSLVKEVGGNALQLQSVVFSGGYLEKPWEKDMIGIMASKSAWKPEYGPFLRNLDSWKVRWSKDFNWDAVGSAKDFNLVAFGRRIDDDDDLVT